MVGIARSAMVVGVLLAGGLVLANPPAAKSVKEIMMKINKGANAPFITMKRDVQQANPKWLEIQPQAKEYLTLAGELKDAQAPPKGDATSWAKLTKDYGDAAKTFNDAVQKKDKAGALSAHTKLTNLCTACHKAHRD